METLAWILLWILLIPGGLILWAWWGQRGLTQYLSEREVRPVATKLPDYERENWDEQYDNLLQATCEHEFNWTAIRWWQCVLCNYQKPWVWKEGCLCLHKDMVVYHRHGNCPFHGRPNLLRGPDSTKL